MSARDDDDTIAARRPLDGETMAAISPLPPPEGVFLDWLMSVPPGADLEEAARGQVELTDRRARLHPDVLRLRTLLMALAGPGAWPKPLSNL